MKWHEAQHKCKDHSSGPMELGQDDSNESHELISALVIGDTLLQYSGQKPSVSVTDEAWLGGIYMKPPYKWCWLYKGNSIFMMRYIFRNNYA